MEWTNRYNTDLFVCYDKQSIPHFLGFLLTKIKHIAYWRQEEQWASIEIVIELAFPSFYAIFKERSVSLLILKYKGEFSAVCFFKHNEVKRVNTEPWLVEEILVAILCPSLFFILLYYLPSTPVSFLSLQTERGQHKHACQGSDRTDLLCKLGFTGMFSPYILPPVLDSIFLSWNIYIFLSWKDANIKHIGYSRNFEIVP